MTSAPAFGARLRGVEYLLRPAAYAVIRDGAGNLAVVRSAEQRDFLVGGASEPGETPEQTVAREAVEECAREVAIDRRIGAAVQYFAADGTYFEMHATFFEAHFTTEPNGAAEHEVYFLPPETAARGMYHQCHLWAIEQCGIERSRLG